MNPHVIKNSFITYINCNSTILDIIFARDAYKHYWTPNRLSQFCIYKYIYKCRFLYIRFYVFLELRQDKDYAIQSKKFQF